MAHQNWSDEISASAYEYMTTRQMQPPTTVRSAPTASGVTAIRFQKSVPSQKTGASPNEYLALRVFVINDQQIAPHVSLEPSLIGWIGGFVKVIDQTQTQRVVKARRLKDLIL